MSSLRSGGEARGEVDLICGAHLCSPEFICLLQVVVSHSTAFLREESGANPAQCTASSECNSVYIYIEYMEQK
jgi:hypothetical protein